MSDAPRPDPAAQSSNIRTPADLLAHAAPLGEAPPRPDADPLTDDGFRVSIYLDHLSEAGFLALQVERLFRAPGVAWHRQRDEEQRLAAHVDAIELGGELALATVRSLWASDDEAEVAAAAWCLLHAHRAAHASEVFRAFSAAEPDVLPAFLPAWRRTPHAGVVALLAQALRHERADVRAAAAGALAFRHDGDPALTGLELADPDPATRAAKLSLAAAHGGQRHAEALQAALTDPDEGVARAALEGLALADPTLARRAARGFVHERRGPVAFAAMLLGAIGRDVDEAELVALRRDPAWAPAACDALGWHGHSHALPALLEALEAGGDDAGVAGVALARITGVRTDDWAGWARRERARFDDRSRWRLGEPWSAGAAVEWLAGPDGDSPSRALAALELRGRAACTIAFHPEWPTGWQHTALGRMREWAGSLRSSRR